MENELVTSKEGAVMAKKGRPKGSKNLPKESVDYKKIEAILRKVVAETLGGMKAEIKFAPPKKKGRPFQS